MIKTQHPEVDQRLTQIAEWQDEGLLGRDEADALRKLIELQGVDSFTGARWINGGRAGVTIEVSFGYASSKKGIRTT